MSRVVHCCIAVHSNGTRSLGPPPTAGLRFPTALLKRYWATMNDLNGIVVVRWPRAVRAAGRNVWYFGQVRSRRIGRGAKDAGGSFPGRGRLQGYVEGSGAGKSTPFNCLHIFTRSEVVSMDIEFLVLWAP